MIGRDELLTQVTEHIESVLKSTTGENVLFITGEAGIGKSTFLKAVAGKADSLPYSPVVAMAQCSTPLAGQSIGEAEALKPWVDIVDVLIRKDIEEARVQKKSKFDVGKFLLDTAPSWIELIPILGTTVSASMEIIGAGFDQLYMNKKLEKSAVASSQQQIFQQYINLLLKINETSPLVIILDDFHWADDSSCNLLFAAARQLQNKPVVFIVAYRPDDAQSSRNGEGHSILHIKNELERYEMSREIAVPRLTATNLDTIMRQRFKNYVNNDEFEEWLAHLAGGNALFITQFLKTLEEDGFLKKDSGEFIGKYEEVKIPKSAFAVVNERIRRLTNDARELLQYASVEGETFTSAILSQITETPPLKALQRLRNIEDTHHIVKSIGKQALYAQETTAYQFAHALIHRAMYETLEEEERELLHEAIFSILKNEWQSAKESGKNLSSMANRIAIHADIAKDNLFAAQVLLEAAQSRWKEFAESEAMQNISFALNSLDKTSHQNKESFNIRGELLHLRGDIHTHKARFPKAIEDFTKASQYFEGSKTEDRLASAETGMAYVYWCQGKYKEAIDKLEYVFFNLEHALSPKQKINTLSQLGRCLADSGELEEGIKKHTEALELARQTDDRMNEVDALDGLGCATCLFKDFDASIQYFEQALQIVNEKNNLNMKAILIGNIANIHYYKGDLPTALRFYEESLALYRITGLTPSEAICLENMSSIFKDSGDFDKAFSLLDEALHICNNSGDQYGVVYALHLTARTYLEAKAPDKAREFALKAQALAEEIGDTFTPPRNNALLQKIEEFETLQAAK